MMVTISITVERDDGVKANATFDADLVWNPLDPRDESEMPDFTFGAPVEIMVHADKWSYHWAPEGPETYGDD